MCSRSSSSSSSNIHTALPTSHLLHHRAVDLPQHSTIMDRVGGCLQNPNHQSHVQGNLLNSAVCVCNQSFAVFVGMVSVMGGIDPSGQPSLAVRSRRVRASGTLAA